MAEVQVSKSINVAAKQAWAKLSSFSGIEEYSPVEICTVVGDGVGATRICYMPNGVIIYEVLEKLADTKMEMQYKITVSPFPITDYVSNIKVEELSEEECRIIWSCKFKVKPKNEEEMKTLFEGLFDSIIDELELLIFKQNKVFAVTE